MARIPIVPTDLNLGTAPNDGTGSQLRAGGQVIRDWMDDINTMTAELYPAVRIPNYVAFGEGNSLDRLAYIDAAGFLPNTTAFRAVLKVRFSNPDAVSTNQTLLSIGSAGGNAAQLVRLFLVDSTRCLQLQCGNSVAGAAGTYTYSSTAETYTLLLSYNGAHSDHTLRAYVSVYDSAGQWIETITANGPAAVLNLAAATEIAIGSLISTHTTAAATAYFQGDMNECRIWADPDDVLVDIGTRTLFGSKERGVDLAGQPTVTGLSTACTVGSRYLLDGEIYTVLSSTSTSVTFTTNLVKDFSGASVELLSPTGVKTGGSTNAISATVLTGLRFDPVNMYVGAYITLSTQAGNYQVTAFDAVAGTITINSGLTAAFPVGSVFTIGGGSVRVGGSNLTGSTVLNGLRYDYSEMYVGAIITIGADTYTVADFTEDTLSLTSGLVADVEAGALFAWTTRPGRHTQDALRSPPELGGSLAGRKPLVYFGGTQTAADWNAGANQGSLGAFTMGGTVG